MTVREMFFRVSQSELFARLFELYPDAERSRPGYELARAHIMTTTPEPSEIACELLWADDNIPGMDCEPYVHVHGVDDSGDTFAIEYTPWSEWLSMEVKVDDKIPIEKRLDDASILAHIIWEMTWVGYSPDDIKKKAEHIFGLCDEVENDIENMSAEEFAEKYKAFEPKDYLQ